MRILEQRAHEVGQRAVGSRLRQLDVLLKEQLPGAAIDVRPDGLRVSGHGLTKRWLANPALRFLSSFGR